MKLFRLSTLLYAGSLLVLAACQPVTVQPASVQPVTGKPEPPTIVEYEIPTANAHASGITVGSDGALWFAETGANQIGRISTDGVISEYPVLTKDAMEDAQGIVGLGPDGAIWFSEDRANKLGRITPDGKVSEYDLPPGTAPIAEIVGGTDGALWVTAVGANAILKLNTEGEVLAEYPLPTPNSLPAGMVAGPDGAFWFVEKTANQVGRITLDGAITEYPIPTAKGAPIRLTVGPDGALWFNMMSANKIGRIDLAGKVTEYAVPGMGPLGLAAGADGAVWFTGYSSGEIGRLTTDGVLTKLSVPTKAAVPYRMVAGPDGNLWFTEQQGNKIGQVKLPQRTALQETPSAPQTVNVIAEWPIHFPQSIVFGSDGVWVPSRRSPNITTRIDPATNQIVAVVEGTGMLAKSAAVVGDAIWVAGQMDDLAPIDAKTNTVGTKVPGNHPRIVYAFGSIWGVGHQGEPLNRVDPATSQILTSIPLTGTGSDLSTENDVWVAGPAVWVTSSNGALIKVDPATNSVVLRKTADQVAEEAMAQASAPAGKGSDFLWLNLAQGLARIDPDTGVGLALVPGVNGALAVTDDAVWVGTEDGHLYRVDVATNQVYATYEFPGGITHLAVGFGSLWAASEYTDRVARLDIVP